MTKHLSKFLILLAGFVSAATPAAAQAVLRIVNGSNQFGRSTSFVGDINGDGFGETACLGLSPSGSFQMPYILDGRTGSFLTVSTVSNLVLSLQRVGDLDGDGVVEVLVAYNGGFDVRAPIDGPSKFSLPGGWYRRLGDVDGDGVLDLARFTGGNFVAIHSGFNGMNVAGGGNVYFAQVHCNWGDLNADGHDDFLLASSTSDQSNAGSSRIVSGADGTMIAPLPYSTLVDAVHLGRIDGDAFDEVAVVSPSGPLEVLSGATRSVLYSRPLGGAATALRPAGDMNLDGLQDFLSLVLVGNGPSQRVTVHSGLDGSPLLVYNCVSAPSVDTELDINRDGYPDIAVGEFQYPNSSTPNGRVVLISGAPTPPLTYCQGKINSLGCEPYVWASGSTSRSGPDNLVVHAANVLNNKLGIMFWGRQGSSAPFLGGTLCISTPFKRTDSQSSGGSSTGSDCRGTFSYAFSQAEMAQNGLGVGSAGYCQFWYRDPGFPSPANVGLTNGVVFTVSF